MTQIFPILNRFLRRNTSSASNIIMWLTGLGSLTYLLLNIYHGVYLPKDTPNATPISAINDRDAVKDSEVSIQDFNIVRIIWKTYVPRKINICKKIQFMFFFQFQPKKVNVTVFYEVLCPDSRHFILRQLFPTWQKVSELMEIDYRPFGKATVSA